MEKLRVAVIGIGRMGMTHAQNLADRVQGVQLAAVTTSDPERAKAARRRLGSAAIYPTPADMLNDASLDAVIISSSTSAHVDNIESCAAAGLHIFCEKPLALSLSGCDKAIEAAKSADVKLMIGHVRQFDSGHVEAYRLIQQGAIGRPLVFFRAISGDVNPPPPSFADPAVSGGLILDALYHDLYLSRWLMADEVIRVYTEGDALVDEGVRSVGDVDNAVVTLRFAGGAIGTLFVSRTTRYGHDLRVEVIGEEGAVQIGRFRQTPLRLLDQKGVHHDMPRNTPDRLGEAFVAELQAFVDSILQDRPPAVAGHESRLTVAVGIAATESMHAGKPVSI